MVKIFVILFAIGIANAGTLKKFPGRFSTFSETEMSLAASLGGLTYGDSKLTGAIQDALLELADEGEDKVGPIMLGMGKPLNMQVGENNIIPEVYNLLARPQANYNAIKLINEKANSNFHSIDCSIENSSDNDNFDDGINACKVLSTAKELVRDGIETIGPMTLKLNPVFGIQIPSDYILPETFDQPADPQKIVNACRILMAHNLNKMLVSSDFFPKL